MAPSTSSAVVCVAANDRMELSRMLADGLSVEAADSGGWRLLHLAARANAADVAQLLLVRGTLRRAGDAVRPRSRARVVRLA